MFGGRNGSGTKPEIWLFSWIHLVPETITSTTTIIEVSNHTTTEYISTVIPTTITSTTSVNNSVITTETTTTTRNLGPTKNSTFQTTEWGFELVILIPFVLLIFNRRFNKK